MENSVFVLIHVYCFQKASVPFPMVLSNKSYCQYEKLYDYGTF